MAQKEAKTSDLGLPAGAWEVDPGASRLEFLAKTMWGMVKVKGHFTHFRGQLLVGSDGAYGELTIESKSLDTGHEKRDEHLRTADFFSVEENPEVTFATTNVKAAGGGDLLVTGTLTLPRAALPLELPVRVVRGQGGRLRVSGKTSVGRKEAGMDWNRIGMMVGDVTLTAEIELVPDAQGGDSGN